MKSWWEAFTTIWYVRHSMNYVMVSVNNNNNDDDDVSCTAKYEGDDSIQNILKLMEATQTTDDFYFRNSDVDTARLHLHKLNFKVTGYDLLPPKVLWLNSDVICNSVCKLMNMSINASKYPNWFKYAEICPVFEKGNKLDIWTYRPVSILPSTSKTFEREIVNKLVSWWRKSCMHDTHVFISRFWLHTFKLFISKLRAYVCSSDVCNYILSYYCNRRQRLTLVKIKTNDNISTTVLHRVPL